MYYLNDLGKKVDPATRAMRRTAAILKRQERKQAAIAKREARKQAQQARQDAKKAGVEAAVITGGGFETVDQSGAPVQDIYAPQTQAPMTSQYPPLAPMQQGGPSALYPFGGPQSGPMQPTAYPQQQGPSGPAQFDDSADSSDSAAIEQTDTSTQEEAEAPQVQEEQVQEASSEGSDMEAGLTGLADLGKAKRIKCQPSFGYPTLAKYRQACNKARRAQGVKWDQKQCACIDQYGRITDARGLLPGQPGAYPPGACPAGYAVDPATGQCVPIQPGQSCPPGYMLAMSASGPQCQPIQQNFQPPYYGGGSFGPVSYGGGPQFDDPYGMAPGLPAMASSQYGSPFPSYSGAQPGGSSGPMFTTEAGLEIGDSGGDGDIGLPADFTPYTGGVGPLPSSEGPAVVSQEQFSELEGDAPDSMSGLGYGPQTRRGGNPMMPVIRRARFQRRAYTSLYPAAQGVDLYPISGSNPLYPAAQGTEFYPDSEATGLDAGLGALAASPVPEGMLPAMATVGFPTNYPVSPTFTPEQERVVRKARALLERCNKQSQACYKAANEKSRRLYSALHGLGELYPAAQGNDLYPISGSNPLYPAAQGVDFYPDSEAVGLNPGLGATMPGEESGLVGMLITGGLLYGLFKVFCKKS